MGTTFGRLGIAAVGSIAGAKEAADAPKGTGTKREATPPSSTISPRTFPFDGDDPSRNAAMDPGADAGWRWVAEDRMTDWEKQNAQPPPEIPTALASLLSTLPPGVFHGACQVPTEYLMNGAPDRPGQRTYSYAAIQKSLRQLEKRRLVLRYAKNAGQLCFLLFKQPLSPQFARALRERIPADVLGSAVPEPAGMGSATELESRDSAGCASST